MFQLLIVDDDVLFIKGLEMDIDQEKFNIGHIFRAYNIRQAKDILNEQKIDIILCDIEMPQGNGLELLTWIRENNIHSECVFLTSHQKFSYAKQAIQLGSIDYLLKPVLKNDLEAVMLKAIDTISKTKEIELANHYKELWNRHHPLIIERFWVDLINQTISSDMETIKKVVSERNISLTEEIIFLPILIGVQRWHKEEDLRGRKLLEYALKNLAEELIIGEDNYGIHIQLEDNLSLIILTLDKDQPIMIDSLITNCELYIESCNRWFNCDLSCYIGNSLGVEFMREEVNRLKFLEKNNVQFDNKVFFLNTGSSPHNEIEMPQMVPWMTMLKKGTNDQLMKEIEIYLKEIKGINATFLRQFHQNLTQMVFFVLNIKGIQAHQLYSDSKSVELSERATKSIKEMMEWVNHIIQKATIQTDMVEQTNTIVQAVKNYIVLNIDDCELSRKDIAGHVFLNEDYLSKLFKKEEGIPLSTFIMEQRMDLAKKLLNTTNMPVGEVASAVGHSNFSHFSKIFRKHTGLNPKDFRHSKTTS